MLEHYSHIRIDAKRQALDALDEQRKNGLREPNGDQAPDIQTIVEISEEVTSQLRHSLTLSGDPPHGKLLIPLARRDVRVVEGARLESVCRGNSTEGSNPSLSANSAFSAKSLMFSRMLAKNGVTFSSVILFFLGDSLRSLRVDRSCRCPHQSFASRINCAFHAS